MCQLKEWKALRALLILFVCAMLAVPVTYAKYKVWVLARFDDTPEGLAIDAKGNIYTALYHIGKIMMVTPDGKQELIAIVPSEKDVGKGNVIGIDLDKDGNIYVAYKQNSPNYEATNLMDPFHAACRDATVTLSGVYKIDATTRKVTPLATRGDGWAFCFPDDIEIDSQGNVFLTDLTYSGIWKISPDGQRVEMWSSHPLLNWSPTLYSGYPLGVNVLVMDQEEKNIYAATDGDPMIVKIPIKSNGSAGEPIVVSRGHSLFDGIELDDRGNIYVSEVLRNEIWVLSPDGLQRSLVANQRTAPLDNNTSLIWHDGMICTANLGFSHFPKIEDADKTIVCICGFDRP